MQYEITAATIPVNGDTICYWSGFSVSGSMRIKIEEVAGVKCLAPYRAPLVEVVVLYPGTPGIAYGWC